MPGLVIAGVAGIAGIVGTSNQPSMSEHTYRSPIPEMMRDAPVVENELQDTQTHRGFVPAQKSVCENVR
ncbi:MAG: hypothetical protein LBJ67_17795 [Planctomycetaceae bacterium]|nr:hypothetical protein [Planctomycetaceae bacterium]